MKSHPLFRIQLAGRDGFIALTPCPATKGIDLIDTIKQFKRAGVAAVVTLLSDHELQQLGVYNLKEVCTDHGLSWVQCAIEDGGVPDHTMLALWRQYVPDFINITETKGVAIHCVGGSGRTGLVAAMLLRHLGYTESQAIEAVQAQRPTALTRPNQRDFFTNYLM